ncbi:MAG: DUF927 domain-containing protein [Zetaproteobacteria bacterium]|nr:DUF927 domain-containing protein [Zetaproteobacteria bacterium]
MMEIISYEGQSAGRVFASMAKHFSRSAPQLTEFALGMPGSARLRQAIYTRHVDAQMLADLAGKNHNLSFLTDVPVTAIHGKLDTYGKRQVRNKDLRHKSVISFDLNFKDQLADFATFTVEKRRQLASHYAQILLRSLQQRQVPLWMLVYSGNGLHLHFKLHQPYKLASVKLYHFYYKQWCHILEFCLPAGLRLDHSCCNPARRMRLPLSLNHKHKDHPIRTQVLAFDEDADASSFFHSVHIPPGRQPSHLSLPQVLRYFGYPKAATLHRRGEHMVCASPFTHGNTPNFCYHPGKRLYYDFSHGQGGGMAQLIAALSKQAPEIDTAGLAARPIRAEIPPRFQLDPHGVWGQDPEAKRAWLCAPLRVHALTCDPHNTRWGRILSFHDHDGQHKTYTLADELLADDGTELRRVLLRLGLPMSGAPHARGALLDYILSCQPTARMRSPVQRTRQAAQVKSHAEGTDSADDHILTQIRRYLQNHGDHQFAEWGAELNPLPSACAGFRRTNAQGEVEWWILTKVFRQQVCHGLRYRQVLQTLQQHQLLQVSPQGPSTRISTRQLGRVRVYRLSDRLLAKGLSTPVPAKITHQEAMPAYL